MAMELPFAVDSSSDNDASSLVTASSQGSLVPADDDLLNLSSLQSGEPQQRQLLQSRGEEETGEDYDQTIVSSFSVLQQQQRANNYCATTYSTPIMNNVSAPTATPRAMTLPPTSQQHPSRLYPQQQHHHQQEVLPTASSSSRSSALYSPTIVDIPPTPQSQQQASSTSNSSFQPQHVAATSVTSTFGVDAALKSAGSRVTSVLSHFGYKTATAPPQQQQHRYPTSDASSNRGASPTTTSSIFSHFTSQSSAVASLPDSYPRGSSSLPSTLPAVHNRSDPSTLSMNGNPVGRTATTIQEHPDTEAIDFAYINVTDEDEVDVWLDENHHHHSRSTQQQQNGLYDSSETTGDDSRRRHVDILTILLEADRLNSPQDDSNNAAQLVSLSEQANAAAARAGAAKRQGRLQDALDRHSDAAKFFHEAARIAQDQDGTTGFLAREFLL